MSLESLANELLLDIFEFLSVIHLIHAFYGLNSRFNALLFNHVQAHHLDFRSISKHNFNTICRQHLLSIASRIVSLCLSDDDDTPQQTDYFFFYGFTLRQFTHLQSLSLYNICSKKTMTRIMIEWRHLPNFIHLKLNKCYFPYDRKKAVIYVNNIWNLHKLTHCYIRIELGYTVCFPVPKVVSLTLEHLFLSGINSDFLASTLFEHTPHLQFFSTQISFYWSNKNVPSPITSIAILNISFISSDANHVINVLQNMPNLCQLTLLTHRIYIDGQKWEQIIHNYLPKLRRFQFKMEQELGYYNKVEQHIDELLESFRLPFWIYERQWCVRCDYSGESKKCYIYTLPYAFDDFLELPILSKSTCYSDDDNYHSSYHRVRNLTCISHFYESLTTSHRFDNLHHLSIRFPVNEYFWSMIICFYQLSSLNVYGYDGKRSDQYQLQAILDRAPNLHSLSLVNSVSAVSQMELFEYRSMSIRQLNLRPLSEWYNNQECTILSHSPLGTQCEVLLIRVENRTCALNLVKTMANLRAMNVRCRDDKWNKQLKAKDDELIQWLKHRLPSTCMITRDEHSIYSNIRLWIR